METPILVIPSPRGRDTPQSQTGVSSPEQRDRWFQSRYSAEKYPNFPAVDPSSYSSARANGQRSRQPQATSPQPRQRTPAAPLARQSTTSPPRITPVGLADRKQASLKSPAPPPGFTSPRERPRSTDRSRTTPTKPRPAPGPSTSNTSSASPDQAPARSSKPSPRDQAPQRRPGADEADASMPEPSQGSYTGSAAVKNSKKASPRKTLVNAR